MTPLLAFFSGLGPAEFVALIIIGILLYGKNLPTVAKTLGRTIGEFKRQMRQVEEQLKRDALHDEMMRLRKKEEEEEAAKKAIVEGEPAKKPEEVAPPSPPAAPPPGGMFGAEIPPGGIPAVGSPEPPAPLTHPEAPPPAAS